MKKMLFIAGIGTEVGKTYLITQLLSEARAQNLPWRGIKPLISGWTDHDSDTHQILKAQGLPITPETIQAISPWRYQAPLSVIQAAEAEYKTHTLAEVVQFCQRTFSENNDLWPCCINDLIVTPAQAGVQSNHLTLGLDASLRWHDKKQACMQQGHDTLLIESAGGLMSPITRHETNLDWLLALQCDCILVSRHYLGSITHTLTSLAALRERGLRPRCLVLYETPPDTLSLYQNFTDIPLYSLRFGEPLHDIIRLLSSEHSVVG
jgi:dethiobiotin synthetase